MRSLGWGSGAKRILQKEKEAWDEEETEPLGEEAKQSDSKKRKAEKKERRN